MPGFEPYAALPEGHDSQYAGRRFNLLLITIFGGLAFVLAAVGIYGTIVYSVSRRTHEIGIRMAVGAQRKDVIRLIMRQGLGVLLIGEALGLAGSLVLNKLMSSLVFQVSTTDLATYAAVSLAWAGAAATDRALARQIDELLFWSANTARILSLPPLKKHIVSAHSAPTTLPTFSCRSNRCASYSQCWF